MLYLLKINSEIGNFLNVNHAPNAYLKAIWFYYLLVKIFNLIPGKSNNNENGYPYGKFSFYF